MKIKVKCMGAGREVGRSSFLVDCGEKILLDHGVKLGPLETEYPEIVRTHLDAIILSHAHLDHSGNIPHLFNYLNALVFATPPTFDLSHLLWLDSMKIADKEGVPPQFTNAEIERTERYAFPTRFRRQLNITDNVSFEFFDAGHITGAAFTKLNIKDKTLLYTGDFKDEAQRQTKAADLSTGKVDYLMIESCYGDREHTPRKENEKRMAEEIEDTLANGGWALLPAFAIGRSQELLEIIYEYNLDYPVYFDGMGQKAARIMLDHPDYLRDEKHLKKSLEKAFWVRKNKDRKEAVKKPSIIVTTAGMMTGGPVFEYLKTVWDDKNSKIFLTGYQVKETPGRVLYEKGVVPVEGTMQKVKCGVSRFDFSAHAGRSGLLKAVSKMSPEKIMVVHGDGEVAETFANDLRLEGYEVVVPSNGDTVDLL
jgi:putative mRNA 3-end processing factor